jgi:hypothetical protein
VSRCLTWSDGPGLIARMNCAKAERFRILAKDFSRASHARSEQRYELVHCYFYCLNNCPQSAAVKCRMHRNGYRIATVADQANVTTLLSHLPITEFIERLNTILSGDGGHLFSKGLRNRSGD